jgi:transcriptional regulator GlxA family with amidase domain
MLDARLRGPLDFRSDIDWSQGLSASLKWQLAFLMHEFERPDGVASNPLALASLTDFLVALALRAAPHNYTAQLDKGPAAAVPRHVRRAEEFMRAHCAEPLRIADVANAAGCSVRTLGDVFRRFRGRTPLAALHIARLERVHAELRLGEAGAGIGAVARRYGFTNASRFAAAFRRHFGETPAEVVRQAERGRAPR